MTVMRFTALRDFYSNETQSQYVTGLSYTAGPTDGRLRELILKWIEEGKVVAGGFAATVAGKE